MSATGSAEFDRTMGSGTRHNPGEDDLDQASRRHHASRLQGGVEEIAHSRTRERLTAPKTKRTSFRNGKAPGQPTKRRS
jgi:hypothetical protein